MPETDTPEDESGFEVIDRRKRVKEERDGAAEQTSDQTREATSEQAPEAASEAAPEAGLPPEVLDALLPGSVETVLRNAVSHLSRLGWESLGLVPSPRTGEVREDLGECQRVIDAIDALAPLARPGMSAEAVRALDTLLSDLKINFVRKSRGRGD